MVYSFIIIGVNRLFLRLRVSPIHYTGSNVQSLTKLFIVVISHKIVVEDFQGDVFVRRNYIIIFKISRKDNSIN